MAVNVGADPAIAGGRLRYMITVGNVSTAGIDGVTVVLQVPTGLQFVYTTDADPNASGCNPCGPNSQPTWSLGSLPAGQTQTIQLNVSVATTVSVGDSLMVPVTLRATGVNPIMVTKTVQVSTSPSATLRLGTEVNPLVPGQTFTLAADIGQIGTAAITGATVTASLPPGLTAGAISDGGVQSTPGQIVWTIGQMTVGQLARRTVDVTVGASVVGGTILAARAVLSYDGAAANPSAEFPVSVLGAAPPIGFTVSATPSPAVPGARVLYQMTVANHSSRAVDGISVLLLVPSGLQFVYTTDADPNASGCNPCSPNTESSWNVGTLGAGASETITINPQVVATQVGDGSLIQSAFVVRATSVNPITMVKTIQVYSHPSAQLAFGTQTNPVTPGQSFTYDVDIGQIGTAALANTVLNVSLPVGLTAGTISDGGTQASPGKISWAIGPLAVGATLHRSFGVTVDGALPAGSILPARAALTYDGGAEVDAVADYAASIVGAALPLTLAITTASSPVMPGARLLYTMTVSNPSARAVNGLTVLFRVPAGLQFVYTTDADPNASGCNPCAADTEASWSIATLAAGATQIITVNPLVLTTVLGGSLVTGSTTLRATGLDAPAAVTTTVPVHQ
jgi:uncharacterized repeat protein (TIGR01451 family)